MIIFFYGEDAFRSRRKTNEIKEKYLNSDKTGSGLSVFDCTEISSEKETVKNIVDVIATPNLLAPKRLVIVKNLLASVSVDEQKVLLEFFKKKKDTLTSQEEVTVFWEEGVPKKSNVLYKFLISNAKSQNFPKLAGVKLEQWALKSLREIDPAAKISKSALEKLISYCGNDNFLLFSELEKLAVYSDGKIIEEKDVEKLVRAKIDGNIFQMVDAIGANDKKKALEMLHRHLQNGDDPFYLLSMFFYQFRNMLKVSDLKENQNYGETEITRETKLHPFVVKKTMAQILRLPFSELKKIYEKLVELDTAVKTGKVEIVLGLDRFVAEL